MTVPVSTSCWSAVYCEVHTVESPGASDDTGHDPAADSDPTTRRPVTGSGPVLVTV